MSTYFTEPRARRRPLGTPVRPASTGGTGGAPSGPAGGDLTGTYPNPVLAPNAVGTTDLTDGAVTDAKITSVAYTKVTGAPAIPTTLPPSGPAGGDLTGTYPNPLVGPGAVGNAEISDVAWTKITGAPALAPPVSVGATAPVAPVVGQLWWRTTDGNLYIYYDDGTSAQWVAAMAPAAVGGAPLPPTFTEFWPDTYTPTTTAATSANNVGMAFTSSVAGCLYAVQFWKVSTDTGTHTATVYRESDQLLLATATFAGESASGWQTVAFPTPIPITAATRYRVAVTRTATWGYLASFAGLASGPLIMDANGYWSTAGYPSNASASCYLVDVVFSPSATFWTDSFVPTTTPNATANINVGMDVTPAVTGVITGVQFWKLATDTGTHVGRVWKQGDSSLLATVTFTGETASGWQTALFASPVPVTAGVQYIVSVSHPNQPWAYSASHASIALAGVMTMDSFAYYVAGSQSAIPTSPAANTTYSFVDILFQVP